MYIYFITLLINNCYYIILGNTIYYTLNKYNKYIYMKIVYYLEKCEN